MSRIRELRSSSTGNPHKSRSATVTSGGSHTSRSGYPDTKSLTRKQSMREPMAVLNSMSLEHDYWDHRFVNTPMPKYNPKADRHLARYHAIKRGSSGKRASASPFKLSSSYNSAIAKKSSFKSLNQTTAASEVQPQGDCDEEFVMERLWTKSLVSLKVLWAETQANKEDQKRFAKAHFGRVSAQNLAAITNEIKKLVALNRVNQRMLQAVTSREEILQNLMAVVDRFDRKDFWSIEWLQTQIRTHSLELKKATEECFNQYSIWREVIDEDTELIYNSKDYISKIKEDCTILEQSSVGGLVDTSFFSELIPSHYPEPEAPSRSTSQEFQTKEVDHDDAVSLDSDMFPPPGESQEEVDADPKERIDPSSITADTNKSELSDTEIHYDAKDEDQWSWNSSDTEENAIVPSTAELVDILKALPTYRAHDMIPFLTSLRPEEEDFDSSLDSATGYAAAKDEESQNEHFPREKPIPTQSDVEFKTWSPHTRGSLPMRNRWLRTRPSRRPWASSEGYKGVCGLKWMQRLTFLKYKPFATRMLGGYKCQSPKPWLSEDWLKLLKKFPCWHSSQDRRQYRAQGAKNITGAYENQCLKRSKQPWCPRRWIRTMKSFVSVQPFDDPSLEGLSTVPFDDLSLEEVSTVRSRHKASTHDRRPQSLFACLASASIISYLMLWYSQRYSQQCKSEEAAKPAKSTLRDFMLSKHDLQAVVTIYCHWPTSMALPTNLGQKMPSYARKWGKAGLNQLQRRDTSQLVVMKFSPGRLKAMGISPARAEHFMENKDMYEKPVKLMQNSLKCWLARKKLETLRKEELNRSQKFENQRQLAEENLAAGIIQAQWVRHQKQKLHNKVANIQKTYRGYQQRQQFRKMMDALYMDDVALAQHKERQLHLSAKYEIMMRLKFYQNRRHALSEEGTAMDEPTGQSLTDDALVLIPTAPVQDRARHKVIFGPGKFTMIDENLIPEDNEEGLSRVSSLTESFTSNMLSIGSTEAQPGTPEPDRIKESLPKSSFKARHMAILRSATSLHSLSCSRKKVEVVPASSVIGSESFSSIVTAMVQVGDNGNSFDGISIVESTESSACSPTSSMPPSRAATAPILASRMSLKEKMGLSKRTEASQVSTTLSGASTAITAISSNSTSMDTSAPGNLNPSLLSEPLLPVLPGQTKLESPPHPTLGIAQSRKSFGSKKPRKANSPGSRPYDNDRSEDESDPNASVRSMVARFGRHKAPSMMVQNVEDSFDFDADFDTSISPNNADGKAFDFGSLGIGISQKRYSYQSVTSIYSDESAWDNAEVAKSRKNSIEASNKSIIEPPRTGSTKAMFASTKAMFGSSKRNLALKKEVLKALPSPKENTIDSDPWSMVFPPM